MSRLPRPSKWALIALCATTLLIVTSAEAFQPRVPAKGRRLLTEGFEAPELTVEPFLVTYGGLDSMSEGPAATGERGRALQRFFEQSSAGWEVRWDVRSDRPHLVLGAGIPFLPGPGNALTREAAGLTAERDITLEDVEALVRRFIDEYADLFRVSNRSLRLDRTRSASLENGRVWFIELQQFHRGVPVEGAAVFFRINSGNLVQFGADRVSDVDVALVARSERARAFSRLLRRLGLARADLSETLDAGTLKVYPTLAPGERRAEGYRGPAGSGYRHLLVWEFVFRRHGDEATYKAVLDAHSGRILQVVDLNRYVNAQVTGGIYPTTNTDPEEVRPFPFATVTNGVSKTTDANGIYDYSGGTATIALNGRYIRINDSCGAISLSNSTNGNLGLGTSGGTDCSTPGFGGAGNTHAARSGFYHLTRINRKAAGFLAGNSWLNGTLQANMNLNQTCNAYWDGTSVNFFRSGGGCSNTGEIAAVFLHEWGHGMDQNSGGAASENGSGEAVGDTFAFLETKDACIGPNFQPGVPCYNCTTCTGVRDMSVFAQGGPRTIARPSTVADNNGINCDRYTCPYFSGITPYRGPMGYEGHCESYIASTANWDLAQSLVSTYGFDAGWAAMDQIWYESLTPSKSAYRVVSGGQCNPSAVVDGCGANNWYTVFLSVDDDDGNLANGTPNGCRIWDAFNAHGIACGSRPACAGGCTPQPIANAGPDQTITPGQSVTIGTPAQPGHTYLWSPGGQTTAQITVSPATTTTYTVTATTSCGSASDSVTVTVQTAGTAVYDPTLRAPKCASVASACDSGASLLLGRDGKGPEPNQPNTINSSCADGTAGTFHSDESNDRLKVSTTDGTSFAAGKTVRIDATVWAWTSPSTDHLDLYYASEATSPSWTFIATLTPTVAGAQTLSATYTLPSGALQAVRANFRYQGSASPCTTGAYDDRDDLVFAVGGAPPVTTVFQDDFETDKGWVTNPSGTDTATTGRWERGDPEPTSSNGPKQLGTTTSGVNDLVTARLAGATPGANDVDGGVTSIRSPAIALPATGTLTLSLRYYLAHGSNATSADFFRVKVVGSTTATAFEKLGAAVDVDGAWATATASLNAFAGQTVRILIEAADNSTASLVEGGVDDVKVTQQ